MATRGIGAAATTVTMATLVFFCQFFLLKNDAVFVLFFCMYEDYFSLNGDRKMCPCSCPSVHVPLFLSFYP